jgi:hypothetical protein
MVCIAIYWISGGIVLVGYSSIHIDISDDSNPSIYDCRYSSPVFWYKWFILTCLQRIAEC